MFDFPWLYMDLGSGEESFEDGIFDEELMSMQGLR
jgi:hypothetical protein